MHACEGAITSSLVERDCLRRRAVAPVNDCLVRVEHTDIGERSSDGDGLTLLGFVVKCRIAGEGLDFWSDVFNYYVW